MLSISYQHSSPNRTRKGLQGSPQMQTSTFSGAEESHASRHASLSISVPQTPASAFYDAAEFEVEADDDAPDGSVATNSCSSDTDTPGPITPATPAWRPRELTLLRSAGRSEEADKHDSTQREYTGNARQDMGERVEGLAIKGVRLGQEEMLSDPRVLRTNQFPKSIDSAPFAETLRSGVPSSRFGLPRELILSPSISTPLKPSKRMCATSSPASVSSSRLPVRRGPAFSVFSNVTHRDTTEAKAHNVETAGAPFGTQQQDEAQKSYFNGGDILEEPRQASGLDSSPWSNKSARNPRQGLLSFKASYEGSGPRRKSAPAPLLLASSRKNSESSLQILDSSAVDTLSASLLRSPRPQDAPRFLSVDDQQTKSNRSPISKHNERSHLADGEGGADSLSVDSDFCPLSYRTPQQSPWLPLPSISRAGKDIVDASREREITKPDLLTLPYTCDPDSDSVSLKPSGDDISVMTRQDTPSCESVRPFEYECSSATSHAPAHVEDESSNTCSKSVSESESDQGSDSQSSKRYTDQILDHHSLPANEKFTPSTPKMSFNTGIFSQEAAYAASAVISPRESSLSHSKRPSRSASASFKRGQLSPSRHVPDTQYLSAAQLHACRNSPTQEAFPSMDLESVIPQETRKEKDKVLDRRSKQLLEALQIPALMPRDRSTSSPLEMQQRRQNSIGASPPMSPSQTPRSRLLAVPEVPAFSFMMPPSPMLSAVESLRPTPFPSTASSPQVPVEDEQQGVSHWSSGSEDESEKTSPFRAGSRKASKRSAHGRRASTVSPSSSLAPKKSAFLNGLGLRKKSVPNLPFSTADANNGLAQVRGSLATDSPLLSRFDFKEFPFPKQSRPSFTFGRSSLSGKSSTMSPSVSSTKSMSSLLQGDSDSTSTRGTDSITVQRSPLERSPAMSRISTQRSETSLRSITESQSHFSGPSRTNFGEALEKELPVIPGDSALFSALSDHAQESVSGRSVARNRASPMAKTTGPGRFLQSRKGSLQSYWSSESPRPRASTISRLDGDYNHITSGPGSSSRAPGQEPRKRSMTLDTSLRNQTLSRNLEYVRLFPSPGGNSLAVSDSDPSKAISSGHKRFASASFDSPSSTPRAALSNLVPSHAEGVIRDAEERSENLSSSVTQNLSPRQSRRVRRMGSLPMPRYPSLTDCGRQWQKANPQQAFRGALGPALLDWTLSQTSTEDGIKLDSDAVVRESDSASDGYGTSDRGSSEESQGVSQGDRAGSGGDDGPNSRDASFKPTRLDGIPDESSESGLDSDSTSSSDSYGASENDLPAVDMLRLESIQHSTLGPVNGPSSSDDAPLGQRLRKIQMQDSLQRQTIGEVPSGQYQDSMDVGKLCRDMQALQQENPSSSDKVTVANSKDCDVLETGPIARASPEIAETHVQAKTAATSVKVENGGNTTLSSGDQGHMKDHRSGVSKLAEKSLLMSSNTCGSTNNAEKLCKTGDAVSDFAQLVRARSRSRIGLRPAAIDISKVEPLPALPRAYQNTLGSEVMSSDSSIISTNEQQGKAALNAAVVATDQRATPAVALMNNTTILPRMGEMALHRVYIGGTQRYTTVRLNSSARVLDLMNAVLKKESMHVEGQFGGWALFDRCSSLGLERPLREYEALADIAASRTSKKDSFLMRRSDFSPYLSQQAVPSAMPTVAGWVYIQDNCKKRSWSKRWLELRHNALYHSKSEKGQHPVQMCHLSSFDVYVPLADRTAAFHAPKKNVFALRSVDAVHLFEDPEKDYAFYLSLTDDTATRQWVTSILRARSLILRQNKANLFRAPSVAQSGVVVPTQPLLSFTAAEQCEKGSLLEQQVGPSDIYRGQSSTQMMRSAPPLDATGNYKLVQDGGVTAQPGNVRRHEEVLQAERKVRMDGKPLIGLIDDMSRFAR